MYLKLLGDRQTWTYRKAQASTDRQEQIDKDRQARTSSQGQTGRQTRTDRQEKTDEEREINEEEAKDREGKNVRSKSAASKDEQQRMQVIDNDKLLHFSKVLRPPKPSYPIEHLMNNAKMKSVKNNEKS